MITNNLLRPLNITYDCRRSPRIGKDHLRLRKITKDCHIFNEDRWRSLNFFGGLQQLSAILGDLWGSSLIFSDLWPSLAISGNLRQSSATYWYLPPFLVILNNNWRSLAIFGNLWGSLTTFSNLNRSSVIFGRLWQSLAIFSNHLRLLKIAEDCWRLPNIAKD